MIKATPLTLSSIYQPPPKCNIRCSKSYTADFDEDNTTLLHTLLDVSIITDDDLEKEIGTEMSAAANPLQIDHRCRAYV